MRIGVVPGSPAKGGVYQYSLSVLDSLAPAVAAAEGDELFVLTRPTSALDLEALGRAGWRVASPVPPKQASARARALLRRALRRPPPPPAAPPADPDDVRHRDDLAAWHARLGLELMIYPVPSKASFEAGTPYVTAVHDLQHRLQPEFPEVSANGEAEAREYLFRNAIRQATLVLADSEVGKEDVLELYGEFGITPDRVKVLPFVPPPYVAANAVDEARVAAVRERYGLPERYFYYPAQFWPHKNHARLVHALARLERDHGIEAGIAFSGSDASDLRARTRRELLALAAELGVAGRVHELGYVPEEDVGPLYRGAVALTMPTFFGPTNIPVLEAWALRCPVLTSDIRGVREQAGDAALLVDPRSVEALSAGMWRLWTDDALRRELAERGRNKLAEYTPEDFRARLCEVVREAKQRVARRAS